MRYLMSYTIHEQGDRRLTSKRLEPSSESITQLVSSPRIQVLMDLCQACFETSTLHRSSSRKDEELLESSPKPEASLLRMFYFIHT